MHNVVRMRILIETQAVNKVVQAVSQITGRSDSESTRRARQEDGQRAHGKWGRYQGIRKHITQRLYKITNKTWSRTGLHNLQRLSTEMIMDRGGVHTVPDKSLVAYPLC